MILGEKEKPSLDELVHHGVKGMKWGQHKLKGSDITSARDRHNDRMNRLDHEANRLSFAKTSSEKQKSLNKIHSIASEKGAHEDAAAASHLTRGEKISTAILRGGLATAVASRNMKKQGESAHELLDTYKNSKLSDYYDASK